MQILELCFGGGGVFREVCETIGDLLENAFLFYLFRSFLLHPLFSFYASLFVLRYLITKYHVPYLDIIVTDYIKSSN